MIEQNGDLRTLNLYEEPILMADKIVLSPIQVSEDNRIAEYEANILSKHDPKIQLEKTVKPLSIVSNIETLNYINNERLIRMADWISEGLIKSVDKHIIPIVK
ncbi:hypothetical protein MAR_005606 [Mya arenaria]|uniref:Uncharacterized protein n=1 Tax=Mya arenaria TaxID=6604 RepID=A0ABY7F3V4_MYAAR|nr:hypothetical protein MAR_005606 [Mya arenaria]